MHKMMCPPCHQDIKHVSGRAGLVMGLWTKAQGGGHSKLLTDMFLSDPRW